ncbi:hypothetical protein [Thalassobacillus hwangdonensis]|uniref:Uncharacterized protein n=1 Tax=Thalassobacillus hwangdonensis TaxID=546108 RepID=A0ABW3L095_9BACI
MGKFIKSKLFMILVVVIIVAGAGYFGFTMVAEVTGDDRENEEEVSKAKSDLTAITVASDDTEASEDSGFQPENVGVFIAVAHDFYNDTTGYGAYETGMDWERQQEIAMQFTSYIDRTSFDSETLQADMEDVSVYMDAIIDGSKDINNVLKAHRYFHDLDIAVNDYNAYDKVWGVTETPVN